MRKSNDLSFFTCTPAVRMMYPQKWWLANKFYPPAMLLSLNKTVGRRSLTTYIGDRELNPGPLLEDITPLSLIIWAK